MTWFYPAYPAGPVCGRLSASRSHRRVTVCTARRRGVPFVRTKGTKIRSRGTKLSPSLVARKGDSIYNLYIKMRRRHLESVCICGAVRTMFTSFVSSRSLSVRGSWGTAPSAFWYGAPGGTQGPLGKGGAAERWRVAYPIGIATRHGAKPATTRTYKSRPTPGRRTGCHHSVALRRR